jgi:hypothetical protein
MCIARMGAAAKIVVQANVNRGERKAAEDARRMLSIRVTRDRLTAMSPRIAAACVPRRARVEARRAAD